MTIATVLNKFSRESANDSLSDLINRAPDETDDLEVFPVLLQSADVRALIEAARNQGLSATGLARRLVHAYLLRARGILLVGSMAAGANRQ